MNFITGKMEASPSVVSYVINGSILGMVIPVKYLVLGFNHF